MYPLNLPVYLTKEQVAEKRREAIAFGYFMNGEWALKEFDKNPNIEFDVVTMDDVYEYLGIRSSSHVRDQWLVKRGTPLSEVIKIEL